MFHLFWKASEGLIVLISAGWCVLRSLFRRSRQVVIIEGAESPLDLPERLSLPRNRGPSNFPSFLLLGKKLIVIAIKKKKKSCEECIWNFESDFYNLIFVVVFQGCEFSEYFEIVFKFSPLFERFMRCLTKLCKSVCQSLNVKYYSVYGCCILVFQITFHLSNILKC